MGYSRWSSDSYTDYSTTNNLQTLSREQVFKQSCIHKSLDPSKIAIRESCNSVLNPASTPIIFGLDVTGSMGFVAETIAKSKLNDVMARIIEEKPVTDPHLMFMGIGDIRSDEAPLQVSQFETDLKIIEELRKLYLEGRGGGNHTESYDLPWYFAAHRTQIDSLNRGKKGYLFTIGDELPPDAPLPMASLASLMGSHDIPKAPPVKQLLKHAESMYKVFHIIAEEGTECTRGYGVTAVRKAWIDLLGPNVIFMRDHTYLDDIVIAVLKVAEGIDLSKAVNEAKNPKEIKYAFGIE